ncbi:transcriptional regulator [Pseudoalteromonas luteoviolacea 2ta16]|uniref:Transcriptional regulator n=2 Tax=Pseudoalteromonas TaxID=53246 RepID=V4JHP0_PSEL2|nr:transcriptional regulator [Pseudoalteromonas luteoviolacea 2ta16]
MPIFILTLLRDVMTICSVILFKMSKMFVKMTWVFSKMISKQDERLISVLRSNARASISELARMLDMSRTTVQSRLQKLEQSGVIQGYKVDFGQDYLGNLVSAHVSIKVKQKLTAKTNNALKQLANIAALYAISGEYDMIAIVEAQSLEQLSQLLDEIGNLDGVERTNSAVILETKFQR